MAQLKVLQRCLCSHSVQLRRTEFERIFRKMNLFNSFSAVRQVVYKSTTVPSPVTSSDSKPNQHNTLRTRFEDRIRSSNNLESLLSLVDSGKKINMVAAASILNRACLLAKQDSSTDLTKLGSDDRIQSLGLILDKMILQLPARILISALGSFLEMSPTDTPVIESLERQVTWLLPKMTAGQLTGVISIHQNHQETEIRRKNFITAKEHIQKRWVEIASGSDIVSLMYYFGEGSEEMAAHLEEKALDVSESMTCKELYHVIYLLSKRGKRNAPLLRALVYHMNRQKLRLSPVQIMNLAFACAKLSIYDNTLLEKMTVELLNRKATFDLSHSGILTSLVHSFGVLRWRHTALLDMFSSFYEKHQDNLSVDQLCTFLLTCVNCNYSRLENEQLLVKLADRIDRDNNSILWLQVVFSLVSLGQVKCELLEKALTPEFYEHLAGCEDLAVSVKSCRQLLSLNTAAQQESLNYSGYHLTQEFVKTCMSKIVPKKKTELADTVVKAIENFAPSPKYMRTDVKTTSGDVIDVELVVDGEGQPQSLESSMGDLHRIAIKIHHFSDLTMCDDHTPTGRTSLTCRQLTQLGYLVVQVPHYDFSERTTVVDQVQYLQSMIKTALKPV